MKTKTPTLESSYRYQNIREFKIERSKNLENYQLLKIGEKVLIDGNKYKIKNIENLLRLGRVERRAIDNKNMYFERLEYIKLDNELCDDFVLTVE